MTHYDTLGVTRWAEQEVIQAAYRALMKKYHPDRCRNDESPAPQITAAYQVLSNPAKKKEYDDFLDEPPEPAPNLAGEPDTTQLEADWSIAVNYFPHIQTEADYLEAIEPGLGQRFQCQLLHTRGFEESWGLLEVFESELLVAYFGYHPSIQSLGRELLLARAVEASQKLSQIAYVLGVSAPIASVRENLMREHPEAQEKIQLIQCLLSIFYGNWHRDDLLRVARIFFEKVKPHHFLPSIAATNSEQAYEFRDGNAMRLYLLENFSLVHRKIIAAKS